ncbi:PKD domain-containing protein [Owenweeksia hongkongensis]|uniref:PKD domain-containing protein n=1 Tax=Owenweeksia hongkongensis TaxID=253245 RepID=UPI003A8EBBD4
MLKKILNAAAVLTALICGSSLFGQAGGYTFSTSASTYVPLGTSAIAVDILADTKSDTVPFGFDFYFEGIAYDSGSVASDGFLSFVVGASSGYLNDLDFGSSLRRPLVAPLWEDMDGNASSSAAAYELSGTAPNRVFTFEWRDWEWDYSSTDSVVSFQVKLYETTNIIEFHYRWECPSCISSASASIGLSGISTFLSVDDIETGSPTVSNTLETTNIDSIVTGQVFSFTPPACPNPSAVVYSDIKTDSISVNWSATGSGPWYIYWGPCGFNQASSGVNLDTSLTTSFIAHGLTSATSYEFRVFEDCGANVFSDTISGGCVSSRCLVQSLPYLENFNFSQGCFSVLDSGATADTWQRVLDYGGSDIDGTAFMFVNSDAAGSVDMDEYLVSPVIDASAITGSLVLEFDQFFEVWTSEDADVEVWDGTQWVTVLAQSGSSVGSFANPNHQSIDITAYANDSLQVRFHYYDANYEYYWAVDNVSIQEVLCQPSSNLLAFAIASDSIAINWEPGAGLSYGVEYGPAGFIPGGGTGIATADTFAIANGLSPQTLYDFYVYDTCAAGNSVALGPITVSTACVKQTVPYTEDYLLDLGCFIVTKNGGTTNDTWGWAQDYTDFNGTHTLDGNTGFAFVNSDGAGPGVDMDEVMVSPMVDASNVTGALVLEFDQYYNALGDTAAVDVWDGTQWVNILKQYASIGAWGSPNHQYIDVTAYANADFQVRFHYYNATYAYYWAIDNFSLSTLPCGIASGLDTGLVTPNSAELSWSANGSLWNIEWGPQGFFQGSGAVGGGTLIRGVLNNPYTLTGLGADSCYSYYVQDTCAGVGRGPWVGPFNFCTPPTCPAPTSLGVDVEQITLNSADIYWTTGGAVDFNIEYDVAGFIKGTGMRMQSTNDTVTLSMLNPGTEYQFYVRDSCSVTDTSTWAGPFSFVTAFPTNYLEDFTVPGPFAWIASTGRLAANTSFTSTTSSNWGLDNFGNSGSSSMRVNLYTSNQFGWAITPSIYLDPTINNLQVEFDVSISEYNSNNQGYLDATDDTVAVVISTDNGKTWSNTNIVWYTDENDTIDVAGEHVVIPLTGYTGYVRFGLYGGSAIADLSDNDIYIDNFEVRTPRACTNPTSIQINEIKTDSALVSWTAGTPGFIGASIIYTQGNQPASTGTVISATNDSVYLSGLAAATEYCVYIVEQCVNGYSDTIGPVCFTTQCASFTAPFVESFESTSTSVSCWTNSYVANSNAWTLATGSDGGAVTGAHGGSTNARMTSTNGGPNITKLVSPVVDVSGLNTVQLIYWYAQEAFLGVNNYINVYYRNSVSDPWVFLKGDSSAVATWKGDTIIIPSTSTTLQVAFEGVDNWGWANVVDDVVIGEPTACPSPTNVVVNNPSCDSVQVSWASDVSSTSSYIEYGAKGFMFGSGTVVANATSPQTISGLMLDTEYDIYVVDSCSMDQSNPSSVATFKTDSVGPVLASFTNVQTSTSLADAMLDFDGSGSTGDGLTYDWDFDNGNTGSGVNAQATYTANGTYNVTLTVTDRCGNTDDTTIVVTVAGISIVENEYNAGIEMYPNPNNGTFKVNVTTGGVYAIEVVDLSGRVVYQEGNIATGMKHTVELQNKAKGVYMVRLKGKGLNVTQRIVID